MRPETRTFYETAVQAAVDHIAGNLDDAADLKALAARACLSPFHFHRVFRGMVGETPLEFARRLRLERAAWRLARETTPVTQIAFDAGFETHEAFTRAFHASYGVAPSGFRRRTHRRFQLASPSGVHFDPDGRVPAFIPRHSGGQAMTVEIREMPELRVGCVRHVGPYNQIPLAFERLGAAAGPAGLFAHPDVMMIGIYYDDPEATPVEALRSDAAITVPPGVPMPAGLAEQRIPAGRYAWTAHRGPYELLGDVWARFLGEWIPASGHRIGDGPSFEVYRNTPGEVPKEQLVTELYVPLA